jgi:hypothetical protein
MGAGRGETGGQGSRELHSRARQWDSAISEGYTFFGDGIEKGWVEAFKWLQLCLKHPPTEADRDLATWLTGTLRSLMKPGQLVEAGQRVNEWRVQPERDIH